MAVRERVAAVTGAASGIGRATALGLSRQGVRVALCDLNTSGLAGVASTIQGAGGQARMVELDVSNQEQATRAMDGIVQAWGRLDVLVNAAGVVFQKWRWPCLYRPFEGIAVDEQANDDIMHLCRFRKANGLAD